MILNDEQKILKTRFDIVQRIRSENPEKRYPLDFEIRAKMDKIAFQLHSLKTYAVRGLTIPVKFLGDSEDLSSLMWRQFGLFVEERSVTPRDDFVILLKKYKDERVFEHEDEKIRAEYQKAEMDVSRVYFVPVFPSTSAVGVQVDWKPKSFPIDWDHVVPITESEGVNFRPEAPEENLGKTRGIYRRFSKIIFKRDERSTLDDFWKKSE